MFDHPQMARRLCPLSRCHSHRAPGQCTGIDHSAPSRCCRCPGGSCTIEVCSSWICIYAILSACTFDPELGTQAPRVQESPCRRIFIIDHEAQLFFPTPRGAQDIKLMLANNVRGIAAGVHAFICFNHVILLRHARLTALPHLHADVQSPAPAASWH